MKEPLVSMIIPTHNRKKMLIRLVNSLIDNTYKKIEIIIVDDASSDNTFEEVKRKYKKNKNIKIVRNKKNLFAAGSKNEGLNLAKGNLIAFIDDDNVADKKLIEELVKVLIDNPEVGEVGPVNYSFSNKNKVIFSKSDRNMWTTKTHHYKTVDLFGGEDILETDDMPNVFMVKAEILSSGKIKFNKNFGIMYEESDFAYRIKAKGYRVYMVKSAKVYHDIEDGAGKKNYLSHFLSDPRRSFTFARNRIIFHSKYSTNTQKLGIYFFWIWIFTFYYSFKLLSYEGNGEFSLSQKLKSVYNYFLGNMKGYQLVLTKNEFI